MRHEVVANTMLVIQGPRAPSAEDWTAHCHGHATLSYAGVLVVADRGCPGPNPSQRTELTEAFKRRGVFPNVAVVTDSAAQRGIVTVMRWLQKNTLQAYAPIRLADALTFAGVAPAARARPRFACVVDRTKHRP